MNQQVADRKCKLGQRGKLFPPNQLTLLTRQKKEI